MPAFDEGHVGPRIAATRKAKRLRQADLAREAFVSLAMVKAVERGARTPSDATLEAIAAALGVDPTRLLSSFTGTERRVHAALPDVSASIAAYDVPLGPPSRSPAELRRAVDDAVHWRLAAQYSLIAQHAPALLRDALAAFHTATDQRAAARLLVAAARSADAVAYKFGARDLSARLIELMRWAAPYAEDPLLTASVAYVRGETFFIARAHAAGALALEAAVDEAPVASGVNAIAARGSLHMRAAVIAGRNGNADAADTHLSEARRLAELLREGTYLGTAFGPESVRVHEVSVAVGLGHDHIDRAFTIAREWAPSTALPAERRSGFWIELARAQLWGSRFGDAFESLKAARLTAPQHTREHPWARETAATLLRLKRADEESLHHFADWLGAV
ncbi:XRE family transcriptional regulator [Streptomyces alfalfae]|uniref:Transcriptional regulator n=1 Tax=Streptomyces alfalfae TaxID=1642299 RepID=A0ABM6GW09_9ACTN|nr:helix-turn-helix transcriptional regulator [Streptomyces alfalfae]APY87765.1 transcriptional regulator [Streptomyces alfalfae]AYA15214.1 XRE family transcriptional regulator [Streptomyces fradiae]RXX35303.1 XRE family transcriptional regulator [Streptomyces alfalfae]RZM83841.1 XRE family transcriptional regulator [Streptomyces alfalfae]